MRSYELPADLCGLSVDRDLYDPLFPPGDTVDILGSVGRDPLDGCVVEVDGEEVINLGTFTPGWDLESLATIGPYQNDLDEGEEVPGRYEMMVWPDAVFAVSDCVIPQLNPGFSVGLWATYPDDEDDSRRILADLIEPLTASAAQKIGCVEPE
ncbi:hypothetical protein [Streptomyces hoynatensis]|uniref:Uncharacterized protein n=1 Tax=Streptomyces hoynatensis TaxID=1141874 RepID=A0A3A9YWV2_9ACTN|nr:hypothetical protein [Streptomyces hoynatensis]RKN40104.1 hypothetical protein D7294_19555 [Streptomyces hoynatensis]